MLGKSSIIDKLLYSETGRIMISIILGLGLASLFKKACDTQGCLKFVAPPKEKLDKVRKYDGKCYAMKVEAGKCDRSKKQVKF
jgi:hypothetical protein